MTYQPITPFRRTLDAAVLENVRTSETPLPAQGINKWEILRELVVARQAFGVSDRELVVLQALLSFHPDTILGGDDTPLVVFPSNAAICQRLNGMACSTMRRHLAGLVAAGVLLRRDSPNGKRYKRRDGAGAQAFGFDLSPLLHRFAEICEAAEQIRAQEEAYKRLRQSVSLMRRDLAGLAAYGAEHRPDLCIWDRLSDLAVLTGRALRRKLIMAELQEMAADLGPALDEARGVFALETEESSTNDAEIEQHYQNSNKDTHDFEPCLEKQAGEPSAPKSERPHEVATRLACDDPPGLPNIPLALVLTVCSEIHNYAPDEIRHWHSFVQAADRIRPMMGISPSAWEDAMLVMGPEQAAVVLASMLERFDQIRSPGGYLRSLTAKAENGAFSCGPMVMALARKEAA